MINIHQQKIDDFMDWMAGGWRDDVGSQEGKKLLKEKEVVKLDELSDCCGGEIVMGTFCKTCGEHDR